MLALSILSTHAESFPFFYFSILMKSFLVISIFNACMKWGFSHDFYRILICHLGGSIESSSHPHPTFFFCSFSTNCLILYLVVDQFFLFSFYLLLLLLFVNMVEHYCPLSYHHYVSLICEDSLLITIRIYLYEYLC